MRTPDRDFKVDVRHGQGIAIGSGPQYNNYYFLEGTGARGTRAVRVFVSTVPQHLEPYSEAAIEVAHRLGLIPVSASGAFSQQTVSAEECREKIHSCDIFVLLIGRDHGPRSPGHRQAAAELEYQWATEEPQTDVLAFAEYNGHAVLPATQEACTGAASRFTQYVMSRHDVMSLRDVPTFRAELISCLRRWSPYGKRAAGGSHALSGPDRPAAPVFYAAPPFVGNAPFTGRARDLAELDNWARSSEPVMVVEAIGGTGKSALTWQWVQDRAPVVIDDLAGRMWWSFYEGSASMKKFLREFLAYITGTPRAGSRMAPADLADEVIRQLRERPLLLVLDGFERLLTAYHRFDPSRLRDEDVDPDKRSLIEANADDLVRRLAAASPSKVLISTRLMPIALQGRFGAAVAGVRNLRLPGLTDADTRLLVHRLGVGGSADAIAEFFGSLGNHPLLVGVVAGLVRDYRRAPGDFDRWRADPAAGAALTVRELDLVQRRTHILAMALQGLETSPQRLLGWISVLHNAVTWETLEAINPFQAETPVSPAGQALAQLDAALKDLDDRALLWWDRSSNTYDMHPIIRAFASDMLEKADSRRANDRIRDHFQALPPEDLTQASSVEDLSQTLTLFRALVGGGRHDAAERLWTRISDTLLVRIGDYPTVIELLAPLVQAGKPALGSALGIAYADTGELEKAVEQYSSMLPVQLKAEHFNNAKNTLVGLAALYRESGSYATALLCLDMLADLTSALRHTPDSNYYLGMAALIALRGGAKEALGFLRKAERLGPTKESPWFHEDIEYWRLYAAASRNRWPAVAKIDEAIADVRSWRNRWRLARLRYELFTTQGQLQQALAAAEEYEQLGRNAGMEIVPAASAATLAKLGRTSEATAAAEESLARLPRVHPALRPHLDLSRALWLLDRRDQATTHAEEAYRQAWCDGPPNINYRALSDASALLRQQGLSHPELPIAGPALRHRQLEGAVYEAINYIVIAGGRTTQAT